MTWGVLRITKDSQGRPMFACPDERCDQTEDFESNRDRISCRRCGRTGSFPEFRINRTV